MVTLSIVTVSFNNADTIGDTLKSVHEQSYPQVEHIIVDGASTDGTQEIIRGSGKHIPRFVSEPDDGIYHAMNKGIGMATGEVVGLLNADDVYAGPGVLSRVNEAFADPMVDCCYGDLEYVARDNLAKIIRYWQSSEFDGRLIAKGWYPPHPTFFVRRKMYQEYGMFDVDYALAADVELMWRFLSNKQVRSRYIPQVLVRMRMGGTSNRSLYTIFRQNVWLFRAMKKNGITCSKLFFLHKVFSRMAQFIRAMGRGT